VLNVAQYLHAVGLGIICQKQAQTNMTNPHHDVSSTKLVKSYQNAFNISAVATAISNVSQNQPQAVSLLLLLLSVLDKYLLHYYSIMIQ